MPRRCSRQAWRDRCSTGTASLTLRSLLTTESGEIWADFSRFGPPSRLRHLDAGQFQSVRPGHLCDKPRRVRPDAARTTDRTPVPIGTSGPLPAVRARPGSPDAAAGDRYRLVVTDLVRADGPGGDGRPQRHARLLLRRRPVRRPRRRRRHTASRLRDDGAHLVDVGGESTRPGAERVDAATEIARVLPVIRELAAAGVPMSIDTTRAAVAEAALAAGADVVNDVSGGLADPDMARVVARRRLPLGADALARALPARCASWPATPTWSPTSGPSCASGSTRRSPPGSPPTGSSSTPGSASPRPPTHNWQLSARLPELLDLGFPLLFGASRKSYLGRLLAGPDGTPRPTGRTGGGHRRHQRARRRRRRLGGPRARRPRHRRRARRLGRPPAGPAGLAAAPRRPSRSGRRHDRPDHPDRPAGPRPARRLRLRARARGRTSWSTSVLELDLGPAARSDDVDRHRALRRAGRRGWSRSITGEPVNLIETLADRLLAVCLADAAGRRRRRSPCTSRRPRSRTTSPTWRSP